MRKLSIAIAAVVANPALACAPAPSCWMDHEDYLRRQEARNGTTVYDLKKLAVEENSEPDDGVKFARACEKYHIHLKTGSSEPVIANSFSPGSCSTSWGAVSGLNPNGDNFLSVRSLPNGQAGPKREKDRLLTDQMVCIQKTSGEWLFVSYKRNGRPTSGWVSSKYISREK